MPKVIDPRTYLAPEQVAIEGTPGAGKTRLATDLPWGPKWGQKAIYVAVDPGSEGLKSVLPRNLDHLIVIKPEPKTVGGRTVLDTNEELAAIASTDWVKQYPEVRTIIVDTMTVAAQDILQAVARAGNISDKHMHVGTPGMASFVNIPMMIDYMATQNIIRNLLRLFFMQPLNLICLFHGDWVEPEEGAPGAIYGGPVTVGKAGIRDICSKFDNLVHLDVTTRLIQGKGHVTTYVAHTQKKGIWTAKLRGYQDFNPIPETDITGNPREFWLRFDAATTGGIHHAG